MQHVLITKLCSFWYVLSTLENKKNTKLQCLTNPTNLYFFRIVSVQDTFSAKPVNNAEQTTFSTIYVPENSGDGMLL